MNHWMAYVFSTFNTGIFVLILSMQLDWRNKQSTAYGDLMHAISEREREREREREYSHKNETVRMITRRIRSYNHIHFTLCERLKIVPGTAEKFV